MQSVERGDQLSISIQVNGKPEHLPENSTISDFLKSKDLHERLVVVEHNGTILRHPDFGGKTLTEGDVLEVVHFVGGGSGISHRCFCISTR